MRPVTQRGVAWISAGRLRPWLWAALIAAWLVWLGVVALSIPLTSAHSYDFDTYYAAAQALRFDHSADIYRVATLNQVAQAHGLCAHTGHFLPPYVYPPLLAILLEPLTLLPCGSAATLWLLLNAALWAAATLLLADVLARRWPERRLAATTLVTLLSLGCLPAYYGLFLGQAHLLILAGFALTLWLAERDRLALAGGALVIIALIKLIPALLLVTYLLRGRWRLIGAAALVGAGLLGVMLLRSSPASVARSLPAGAALLSSGLTSGGNEALVASLPPALHLVGLGLAALIGLLWLLALWRRRGGAHGDDLLAIGWTLCVMLLISPLVWSFYLIWLTPTFIACATALGPPLRRDARVVGLWLALAGLYLCIVLPIGALHVAATLALWGLAGALYWRSSSASPSTLAPAKPIAAVTSA